MFWANLFRASKLSIEYVYCGLRAGPVNIYSIFEFLYSVEDLNDVSAGEQPLETRLVFKTFLKCVSTRVATSVSVRTWPGLRLALPRGNNLSPKQPPPKEGFY